MKKNFGVECCASSWRTKDKSSIRTAGANFATKPRDRNESWGAIGAFMGLSIRPIRNNPTAIFEKMGTHTGHLLSVHKNLHKADISTSEEEKNAKRSQTI